MSDADELPGSWIRSLHAGVERLEDDSPAPVDPVLVARFVAGQCSREESLYVATLAATYRSWDEAISAAMLGAGTAEAVTEGEGLQPRLAGRRHVPAKPAPRSGPPWRWMAASSLATAATLLLAFGAIELSPTRTDLIDDRYNYGVDESISPRPVASAIVSPYEETVFDDRPTLRWRLVNGARPVKVELLSGDGKTVLQSLSKNEATSWPPIDEFPYRNPSDRLKICAWPVPEPLARNRFYRWRVHFEKDAGGTFIAPAKDEIPAYFFVAPEVSW